jgi:hypothetical protein
MKPIETFKGMMPKAELGQAASYPAQVYQHH